MQLREAWWSYNWSYAVITTIFVADTPWNQNVSCRSRSLACNSTPLAPVRALSWRPSSVFFREMLKLRMSAGFCYRHIVLRNICDWTTINYWAIIGARQVDGGECVWALAQQDFSKKKLLNWDLSPRLLFALLFNYVNVVSFLPFITFRCIIKRNETKCLNLRFPFTFDT